MFYVVLDTNVFAADWHLKSVAAQACLDMCRKTSSIFLMPRLVLEEVEKQYEEKLIKQRADYNQQARGLNRFYEKDKIKLLAETDTKAETQKYVRDLLRKLGIKRKDILGYPADALPKLVRKAVNRIKPFTAHGEEFRDALLWETVKANLCPDGFATTVFISQDSAAFVDKNDPLRPFHPVLLEEVEEQRVINETARKAWWFGDTPYFEFYGSLKAFVQAHYQHVEHINMDWIKTIVDKNRLKMILNEFQKYRLDGLTKGAIKLVKNTYGKEVLDFTITDAWLSMKQFACDFVDFSLYDFSQDAYGLTLGTTGTFTLGVYGEDPSLTDSAVVRFFKVGYKVEFGLGITRDAEGKYQVDYSEIPSFEEDVNWQRKAKQEGLPIDPSPETIRQGLQDLYDIHQRLLGG
jgi:PIN domain